MFIPFNIIENLAQSCGACEIFWRESDVSESGAIAEIYFKKGDRQGHEFFAKTANVCEHMIRVRSFENFNVASIPCDKPETAITLGYASRGSKLSQLSLKQLFDQADDIMSQELYQS